ncbi:TetR/AcrR family transcriptional regulator [Ruminococcaceae bacterium OttesenSCG-928-D13]|nr:TetR/AcrR family transcriptional regulator [Ruminococcaceae bacterium OttesenSCG-928-D13]
MYEKLPEEKRHQILLAAFSCFGNGGYRKASIADIAKTAGISKASVFQYFGTKK